MTRIDGPAVQTVRMRFSKMGPVRFLGHLDLLKSIERALRRAEIPVSYSEGFHPMIRISFGPALAVGLASRAEWMDLELGLEMDALDLQARFNAALPPGLHIDEARVVPLHTASLQALIRRAVYHVGLDSCAGVDERIAALLSQQEIAMRKKNKVVNLRSFIEDLRVAEAVDGQCLLEMTLRLGPEGAVRPEDVLVPLLEGSALRARAVERVALLCPRGDAWVEPWPATS